MQVPCAHCGVMNANVVLALIISQIILSWVPLNEVVPLIHLAATQKHLTSMERDRCRWMMLLAMQTAVLLSQCTGVADCGCPSSLRMRRKIFPSLQLRKRAPSSASAAVDATSFQ